MQNSRMTRSRGWPRFTHESPARVVEVVAAVWWVAVRWDAEHGVFDAWTRAGQRFTYPNPNDLVVTLDLVGCPRRSQPPAEAGTGRHRTLTARTRRARFRWRLAGGRARSTCGE
ncbi:hypothetical protein GCM10027589_36270 [Actinocorallia lasiicapitis]